MVEALQRLLFIRYSKNMTAKKSNPIHTVLTIVIGFLVLYLIFKFSWALNMAIAIGILGLLSNRLSSLIDAAWMKLAKVLSYIVPNLLLSVIFYFILFPLALLSKLFGNKDELHLKNKATHNWKERTSKIKKVDFEKMW